MLVKLGLSSPSNFRGENLYNKSLSCQHLETELPLQFPFDLQFKKLLGTFQTRWDDIPSNKKGDWLQIRFLDTHIFNQLLPSRERSHIPYKKGVLSRWFSELPIWWDMLVSWRVSVKPRLFKKNGTFSISTGEFTGFFYINGIELRESVSQIPGLQTTHGNRTPTCNDWQGSLYDTVDGSEIPRPTTWYV